MREAASVRSIEALRRFRAALQSFIEAAGAAIISADVDAQRTGQWLTMERPAFWKHRVRQLEDEVARARQEISKKVITQAPEPPSLVLERKALNRAIGSLDRAKERQAATKKWASVWERESLLCKGPMSGLSDVLHGELVDGVTRIERMIDRLDEYLRAVAPESPMDVDEVTTESAARVPSSHSTGVTVSRGGGDAPSPVERFGALREVAREVRERARVPRGELLLTAFPAGEPVESDAEALRSLSLIGEAVDPRQTLAISWRCVSEHEVVLARFESRDETDSGWSVGPIHDARVSGACWRVPVSALLELVPGLATVLSLRVGTMVVLSLGNVLSVLGPNDEDAWAGGWT